MIGELSVVNELNYVVISAFRTSRFPTYPNTKSLADMQRYANTFWIKENPTVTFPLFTRNVGVIKGINIRL